jgi:hypothetical protein
MRHIYLGLLGEGSTDERALLPLVDAAIAGLTHAADVRTPFVWDVSFQGKSSDDRIASARASREYDLLVVHRDGAGDAPRVRRQLRDSVLSDGPSAPREGRSVCSSCTRRA